MSSHDFFSGSLNILKNLFWCWKEKETSIDTFSPPFTFLTTRFSNLKLTFFWHVTRNRVDILSQLSCFFDSFCEYPFFCGFTISPDDTGGYLECVYMFVNFCSSVYLWISYIYLPAYLVNTRWTPFTTQNSLTVSPKVCIQTPSWVNR